MILVAVAVVVAITLGIYGYRRDPSSIRHEAVPFAGTLLATLLGVYLSLFATRWDEESSARETFVKMLSNAWVLSDHAEAGALARYGEAKGLQEKGQPIPHPGSLFEMSAVFGLPATVEFAKFISPEGRLNLRSHLWLASMFLNPERHPASANSARAYAQAMKNLTRAIGIEILYQRGAITAERLRECQRNFPFPWQIEEPHEQEGWPCSDAYTRLAVQLRPYDRPELKPR